MRMKHKGFVDPLILPIIIVVGCMVVLIGLKIISEGHETPMEKKVEQVLEEVITEEVTHIIDKPE